MDKLITLKESVETQDSYGEVIKSWIDLVKTGDEIATGTLTADTLYQITATETNHFYTGCAVYDVFTAAGTETCDALNKVKPVTFDADVWAERLELRGTERWAAQQIIGETSCRFKIRYRDDVTNRCRVRYDSVDYDIHAALELGRREGLELIVSTRAI